MTPLPAFDDFLKILEVQGLAPGFVLHARRFAKMSVFEYSQMIHEVPRTATLDPLFEEVWMEYLKDLGYTPDECTRARSALCARGLIQTAPHIGITPSERMTCIDWISTAGLPVGEPYLVAYYSAIPASNSSRPGVLVTQDMALQSLLPKKFIHTRHRVLAINLLEKSMQKKLISGASIPKKAREFWKLLPHHYRSVVPEPTIGADLATWFITSTRELAKRIFPHHTPIFWDINECVRRVIIRALKESKHPITQLLTSEHDLARLKAILGYSPTLFLDADLHEYATVQDPEVLEKLLINKTRTPALFLTFFVTCFLNGITPLGSFIQIDYLPTFYHALMNTSLVAERGHVLSQVDTRVLTTGMFSHTHGRFLASDWITSPEKIFPNPQELTMQDIWEPLMPILLPKLFTQ
jgi:hypothetical protein